MKKFLNKLDIERKTLKPVNKKFGEPQLCGLTKKAIEQWHLNHLECELEIYQCLLAVSKSIGALSERSGERFDEQYLADSAQSKKVAEELIRSLKMA